jgi:GxxExxY protein
MSKIDLTPEIINAAIEVHSTLGPGLLESTYRKCLHYELTIRGLRVVEEKPIQLRYKNVFLEHGFRLDLLVEDSVVIELKAVDSLTDAYGQQVLTYLRLGNYPYGLLMNFNEVLLKYGLKRFINSKAL